MTHWKHLLVLVSALCMGSFALAQGPQPVNPHASPEARALLTYLQSIRGKGYVTGQHNYPYNGARWTDYAWDLSDKYPGLFGGDFGFSAGEDKDSVLSRPEMLEEVKRQYAAGALIALTWHEVRPTDEEPVTFSASVQGKLSDHEWKELLTPGTPLNKRWCDQVDVVAGYLKMLRDAHIPVLYRPYHEMNGGWFWWGGRPGKNGSAAVYRMLYDRFVNVHHLDNLVWVWNLNAPNPGWPPALEYYPGADVVDVVTLDNYGEFKQAFYDELVKIAGDKPLALAEVGTLPTVEVLEKQPLWSYYMVWSEWVQYNNPLPLLQAVTHAPRAINRGDARLAGPMEAIRKATAERTGGKFVYEPATDDATAAVRDTLALLSDASKKGMLSGAQDGAADAGKLPMVFAAELGATADSRKAAVQAALTAHGKKQVVQLSWRPGRPSDGAQGLLSEFEWNELLTPGSSLNQKWAEEVDAVAAQMKELEKAGVAVVWAPYPEASRRDLWWSGRRGQMGSEALYRQLFERLVRHDGVKNLIWVWQTLATEPEGGNLFDYFPGPLYVDAVQLRVDRLDIWPPVDHVAVELSAGKPTGLEFTGDLPATWALLRSNWSWFVAGTRKDSSYVDALRTLLNDPHVATLSNAK